MGLLGRLAEIFQPQLYEVADLGDFARNRARMSVTNKPWLAGWGVNGLAFVEVYGSCLYDSFDDDCGALNDMKGSLDVSLSLLPSLESLRLTQGVRLYEVQLAYNPQQETVFLSSYRFSPSSGSSDRIPRRHSFAFS